MLETLSLQGNFRLEKRFTRMYGNIATYLPL